MECLEHSAKIQLEKEIGLSSVYYDCAFLNCLQKQKPTSFQNILFEYNLMKQKNAFLNYALFRSTLFFGLISKKLYSQNYV